MARGAIGILAIIAIIIVVVIIAAVAFAWMTISKYIHTSSSGAVKVFAANKTGKLSQLMSNITSGFNTSQFGVSYAGNATINLNGLQITVPLNVSFARYYNDSRASIRVSSVPLIGNISVIAIKDGNIYYGCSSGGNSSRSSGYQCKVEPESNSIFTAFNLSAVGPQQQFGNSTVRFGTVNQSSYQGMPCTNIDGYLNLSSANTAQLSSQGISSEIPSGQLSSGNLSFLTCVSNSYKIPLRLTAYMIAKQSNSTTSGGLQLRETGFERNSSSAIAQLPGPLVNSTG